MKKRLLNLCFSPDGGAGAGGAAGGQAAPAQADGQAGVNDQASAAGEPQKRGRRGNPLANVVYGKQSLTTDQPAESQEAPQQDAAAEGAEREQRWKDMIQGEFKELYGRDTSSIVSKRVDKLNSSLNAARADLEKQSPIMAMLMDKYGVQDVDKLQEAMRKDASLFREEAARRGVSEEDLAEQKWTHLENERLRAMVEQMQERENAGQMLNEWDRQSEALKAKFPDFDFHTECENEEFMNMLGVGVSVEAAYKAIHADELFNNAITYTAKTVQKQVADTIRARGNRPMENGMQSGAGIVVKDNVRLLTRADREEAERRALLGDRIYF